MFYPISDLTRSLDTLSGLDLIGCGAIHLDTTTIESPKVTIDPKVNTYVERTQHSMVIHFMIIRKLKLIKENEESSVAALAEVTVTSQVVSRTSTRRIVYKASHVQHFAAATTFFTRPLQP